jgi:hypothetical protein
MAKKADSRRFKDKVTEDIVTEAEAIHRATCITFASQFDNPGGLLSPGGQCACCGASPRVDGPFDWWLVFRAGFCDPDGVFMAMLCGGPGGVGCLPELRADAAMRKPTFRDEAATIISDLLGDDLDGARAMFEDADFLGMLDGFDP